MHLGGLGCEKTYGTGSLVIALNQLYQCDITTHTTTAHDGENSSLRSGKGGGLPWHGEFSPNLFQLMKRRRGLASTEYPY